MTIWKASSCLPERPCIASAGVSVRPGSSAAVAVPAFGATAFGAAPATAEVSFLGAGVSGAVCAVTTGAFGLFADAGGDGVIGVIGGAGGAPAAAVFGVGVMMAAGFASVPLAFAAAAAFSAAGVPAFAGADFTVGFINATPPGEAATLPFGGALPGGAFDIRAFALAPPFGADFAPDLAPDLAPLRALAWNSSKRVSRHQGGRSSFSCFGCTRYRSCKKVKHIFMHSLSRYLTTKWTLGSVGPLGAVLKKTSAVMTGPQDFKNPIQKLPG
mmetsp:Transcript_68502/g.173255  ORF Transcript_68502/g.173255 Transcript_68502/m.173255 type:complete len:271 (-) Transcript_68502:619-1431(-)